MRRKNVNVNRCQKGGLQGAVYAKKSDVVEQKPICKPCKPLSRDNAHINNNAHITRNAQEKSTECIARVGVYAVCMSPTRTVKTTPAKSLKRVSEKEVEQYLVKWCNKLGFLIYKFESPGRAGVPDRIIILRGGTIFFVELKRPKGGKLSRLQKLQIRALEMWDANVRVLWSKDDVDAFLKEASDIQRRYWRERYGDEI